MAAKIVESEALLKKERAAGDDAAAGRPSTTSIFTSGHRALRRIQDSRHETVDVRIIVLGEGDEASVPCPSSAS